MATSHFHSLFCCNSPPFLLSHYLTPSKTISYFHSHLHSSSFQTVRLLSFAIYIYLLAFLFSSLVLFETTSCFSYFHIIIFTPYLFFFLSLSLLKSQALFLNKLLAPLNFILGLPFPLDPFILDVYIVLVKLSSSSLLMCLDHFRIIKFIYSKMLLVSTSL